jgi:hypothetical protein
MVLMVIVLIILIMAGCQPYAARGPAARLQVVGDRS